MANETAILRKPEPFFLPSVAGRLCALYYPPDATTDRGLDVVHVHPFANELYDTRPVVSYQARELAKSGVGVFLVDLFGCGDSEGDFVDATWEHWLEDINASVKWLREHGRHSIGIWGTRLGALLSADYLRAAGRGFECCILWQPVISGEQLLTQFLRLRVAFSAMSERGEKERITTKDLRARFAIGESVEVAGYEINPKLAHALDRANLKELLPRVEHVSWVEVVQAGGQISVASRQVIDAWSREGVRVDVFTPAVKPFWNYARAQANEYPELVRLMRRINGLEDHG